MDHASGGRFSIRYTVTRLFVRHASINISVVILFNSAILSNNCLRFAANRVEPMFGAYQQALSNQRRRSLRKVIELIHVR